MTWAEIIEINRAALLRIVMALLDLAGMAKDGRMTRQLRGYLMRILRPAESAVRRLIVIAARDMVADVRPDGARAPSSDKRASATSAPTVASLALLDPLKHFSFGPPRRRSGAFPRITFIGLTEPTPIPPAPSPEDMVDAAGLCRRLVALRSALDDIDAQARRLVRWQARCDHSPVRIGRRHPMRPGYPPGRRKRQIHEVDEILRNCHLLALHALSPNSS